MDLFISGEISDLIPGHFVYKKYSKARSAVEGKLKPFLLERNYGNEVLELGIIPIIVKITEEMEKGGWHKERKLFQRKSKSCDFRLRVDYDKFQSGTDQEREKLLIKNIIDSVRILGTRAKRDFQAKELEADILGLFHYQYLDLGF
jgi:Immunity protein 44